MKKPGAYLTSGLACLAILAAGAVAAPATMALHTVKPLICEHECGGSWGAYEHAKVYAERARSETAHVQSCSPTGKNEAGVAQWICTGYYGVNGPWHFRVKIDPYGYQVGSVETYT